jgi:hypothetical protein
MRAEQPLTQTKGNIMPDYIRDLAAVIIFMAVATVVIVAFAYAPFVIAPLVSVALFTLYIRYRRRAA